MRGLLARLELISYGSTQAWGCERTGSGGHGTTTPSLPGQPAHLRLRRNYQQANNWDQRQDVIDQAKHELRELYRTAPAMNTGKPETRTQKADRAARDDRCLELTPEQVCQTAEYRDLKPREVASARARDARAIDTGRPREEDDDLLRRVTAMRDAGMTQTQIAKVTKKSQPTIHRLLKRAA